MYSRKTVIAAAVITLLATPAIAVDGVAEQISHINEHIAVLTAQQKEMDLQMQIATKQSEIDRLGAANIGGAGQSAEVPVIRGIEGVDGRLKATLVFSGGIQQTVTQGEKTRGGWTVVQIDASAVTLSRGKNERVRLGFGNEPPTASPSQTGIQGQFPPPR